jgi:hypothetical protein
MDCTLIIPTTVVKFSSVTLSALIASTLGISGPVGLRCDWRDDEKLPQPPRECIAVVPDGTRCELLNNIWATYAPIEDDIERVTRIKREAKEKEITDSDAYKSLLDKVKTLESKVK